MQRVLLYEMIVTLDLYCNHTLYLLFDAEVVPLT